MSGEDYPNPLSWDQIAGLRSGADKPFDQLLPETGIPGSPSGEDAQPFTQPGTQQGTSPNPTGGSGVLKNVIIVFNSVGEYCDVDGKITGPV